MKTFISLLRGINVSGQNKIHMQDLRGLYESLGLNHVRSYVQSGNILFKTEKQDALHIAGKIENTIEGVFGFELPVIVREVEDFQRILNTNPFIIQGAADPKTLYVTFLYRPVALDRLANLENPNSAGDAFVPGEQEVFLYCPGGYGKTKYNNNFFERKLGVAATTRNWKTVNTLFEMTQTG